jgi:hypothetical protein
MIMISKTVIESAIVDTKKLLAEEGLLKLQGKSREWVCQLYEVLLKNGELYLKHIKLVQKMQALKKAQSQERRESDPNSVGRARTNSRVRSNSRAREMQSVTGDGEAAGEKKGFWSFLRK